VRMVGQAVGEPRHARYRWLSDAYGMR
jgi:hypothetical protein